MGVHSRSHQVHTFVSSKQKGSIQRLANLPGTSTSYQKAAPDRRALAEEIRIAQPPFRIQRSPQLESEVYGSYKTGAYSRSQVREVKREHVHNDDGPQSKHDGFDTDVDNFDDTTTLSEARISQTSLNGMPFDLALEEPELPPAPSSTDQLGRLVYDPKDVKIDSQGRAYVLEDAEEDEPQSQGGEEPRSPSYLCDESEEEYHREEDRLERLDNVIPNVMGDGGINERQYPTNRKAMAGESTNFVFHEARASSSLYQQMHVPERLKAHKDSIARASSQPAMSQGNPIIRDDGLHSIPPSPPRKKLSKNRALDGETLSSSCESNSSEIRKERDENMPVAGPKALKGAYDDDKPFNKHSSIFDLTEPSSEGDNETFDVERTPKLSKAGRINRIPKQDYGLPYVSTDYDASQLHRMPYGDLLHQQFDYNPKSIPSVLPQPELGKPFSSQLAFALNLPPDQQAAFCSSISTAQWEESGDWFLEQFSGVVDKMREARKERRKVSEAFEKEVAQREETIRRKIEGVEQVLDEMKRGGNSVLHARR